MAIFSPVKHLFFWFRPSSGGKMGSKLDQTCKFWLYAVSVKIWIFERFLKHCFSLLEYYLWWKFNQNRTIFGGVRVTKPPKLGHYMDAGSVQKTLKIYNLTITHAILIKLTTIMYLHATFHLTKNWDYIKSPNICDAVPCNALLVKIWYKLDLIWVSNPWKTTQNEPKMTVFRVMIIFEGL